MSNPKYHHVLRRHVKAIMVCVDYADLLAITLPYNRHHFKEVMIVTTEHDKATIEIAQQNRCMVYTTDAFYRNGAIFNKWLALEEGLDRFRREGWICIMDADVLWPKDPPEFDLIRGKLFSPLRRMYDPFKLPIPHESLWGNYPIHPNVNEWAGYSQLFWAEDPVLLAAPHANGYWHETDWTHAGGADSIFQFMWKPENKVRMPFECLHLGPAGLNWGGRASPLVDGRLLPESKERRDRLFELIANRRRLEREGKGRFSGEKLNPQ